MPKRQLPKVDSHLESELSEDPHLIGAYNICLKYEGELATDGEVRRIRILGFLLLCASKRDVRVHVAKSILSCQDEPEILVKLGYFFELHVILPFKKYRSRTPASSAYSTRSSPEQHWQDVKASITQAPKNYQDAKDRALIRDNWRCVLTGYVHLNAPAEVKAKSKGGPGQFKVYTECAHIIPEATFFNVKEISSKLDYSACILAILERFRYDISSFNGEKMYSMTNVMTMEKNMHEFFDRLQLYFEAVPGKANCYQVKHFLDDTPPNMYQIVQFSTADPKHLQVPSPELLALHATCCKVAHMSGAAEYIDQVYDDVDEMGVLAHDGASGDVLSYKLLSLARGVDVP